MELVLRCTKSELKISYQSWQFRTRNQRTICVSNQTWQSDLKTAQIGNQMSFDKLEGRNALQ
jgi:hypothetical protein